MNDFLQKINNMTKAKDKKTQDDFKNEMFKKTKEYQKVYDFETSSDPKYATLNNESDAFKHTFMSAVLSLRYNTPISIVAGHKHEIDNLLDGNPRNQSNMDFHNNKIGRDIARKIKSQYKNVDYHSNPTFFEDKVAEEVVNKMKKGELITTPNDERAKPIVHKIQDSVKNFKNQLENLSYDSDHDINEYSDSKGNRVYASKNNELISYDDLENLNRDDRVMYEKEMGNLLDKDNEPYTKAALKNFYSDKKYSQLELNSLVAKGEMIYVESYVRRDGTRVSGYYRTA